MPNGERRTMWTPPEKRKMVEPEQSVEREQTPEEEDFQYHQLNCTQVPTFLEKCRDFVDTHSRFINSASALVLGTNAFLYGYPKVQEYQREHETVEDHEARLDTAHHEAAEALRNNEALNKKYSPEQIEAVAVALDSFSSKDFFATVSKESGLSEEQVVKLNDSENVFVYADETIDQYIQADLGPAGSRVITREDKQHMAEWASSSHAAGLNNARGTVFLNLTSLISAAGGNPERLRTMTTDVLYHEHTHSFSAEKIPNRDEHDPANMLYEGTTELLSNIVRAKAQGVGDVYPGYEVGPTAAAAVLYEGLPASERMRIWQGYIKGNEQEIGQVYDTVYGNGSYTGLFGGRELSIAPDAKHAAANAGIIFFKPDEIQERYYGLVLLDNALTTVVKSDKDVQVADQANFWLGGGLIVPIRAKSFHGVNLVYPDGAQRGFIRLEGEKGVKIISLIQSKHGRDDFLSIPETNMAMLWTDLGQYNALKTPIYDLSFEDRGAAVVKMIKAHRKDIDTLK